MRKVLSTLSEEEKQKIRARRSEQRRLRRRRQRLEKRATKQGTPLQQSRKETSPVPPVFLSIPELVVSCQEGSALERNPRLRVDRPASTEEPATLRKPTRPQLTTPGQRPAASRPRVASVVTLPDNSTLKAAIARYQEKKKANAKTRPPLLPISQVPRDKAAERKKAVKALKPRRKPSPCRSMTLPSNLKFKRKTA